ncbi:sulfatase-like hydrolase/transferase [Candidatus Woesearchaeota archaeon]|jgi:hypothetical protein|nr:sulfatase-like hydrolase/transferase [Candidatus Woesearchaeota archaeon]
MNNIQKSLIIGFTLASFTFIHAINLIKENIFELNLGSIEKYSLIINYLCLGIILFGICLLLNNNQSKLSKNIFLTIILLFFIGLFSNQIYGVYDMPIDLAPRSILVLFITFIFIIITQLIKYYTKLSFLIVLQNILLIISPISLIVLSNIIFLPIDETSKKIKSIPESSDSLKTPVFIVLFDMLPEYRLKQEIQKDSLPNFTKFIKNSIYLDKAYSTGTHTVTSINGMFYSALIEEIDRSVNSELKFKKVDSKNWSSSKTSKNIFSDMTSYGYNTNIIGAAHIPFSKWYGKYVNSGYFYIIAPPINNFSSFILYPYMVIYNFLFPKFIKERIKPRKVSRMNGLMQALPPIIKDSNDFTYIHFPIPHHEFVFERKGRRTKKYININEGFIGQLYYSDTILGLFVDELKKKNIYEKSLIIITSDHGWVTDPQFYKPEEDKPYWLVEWDDQSQKAHVPFIIKMPHQKESFKIKNKYSHIDVRNLLKNIIKDNKGLKDVIPYIENYDSNNEIRFTKHISEDDDWDKLKETVLIVK